MVTKLSTKAMGAALALEFASVCAYRGATVCEPFGDFSPYDLLLDVPKVGFFRVQVKAASLRSDGKYTYNTQTRIPCVGATGKMSSKAQRYSQGVVDALVSKIGVDWFIHDNVHTLPASVTINPTTDGKYASATNAWGKFGL